MFQIFRHRNRVVVDQFMEHAKEEFDPQKNLANQFSCIGRDRVRDIYIYIV